jgi:hypothetical protein
VLNDLRLRTFLEESLDLWGIEGRVDSGEHPAVAIVRATDGTIVWIERPLDEQAPFRWLVRWRAAGAAPGGAREQRPRPCGSLVGVLKTLRGALDVDRGGAVRIVPAAA